MFLHINQYWAKKKKKKRKMDKTWYNNSRNKLEMESCINMHS